MWKLKFEYKVKRRSRRRTEDGRKNEGEGGVADFTLYIRINKVILISNTLLIHLSKKGVSTNYIRIHKIKLLPLGH